MAVLLLLVAFAAGVASSALVIRRPEPLQTTVRSDFLPLVVDRLVISEEQRLLMEEILERRSLETGTIITDAVARLQAIVDSTTAELRAILDEDQRPVFDSLVAAERSAPPVRRPPPG